MPSVPDIATVLTRLEKADMIAHRTDGRHFIYRPLVSRTQLLSSIMRDLADQLFHGDSTALVSHLLRESEIGTGDLERVKAILAAKEKRRRVR